MRSGGGISTFPTTTLCQHDSGGTTPQHQQSNRSTEQNFFVF